MIDGEEKLLIMNAIKGEASAFGSLYDKYQPRIYRFIYLKVGHREEAEDLCHQVFLSAWQNISNYKFKGFSFSAWVYSIARNKIIDYYRTKKHHQNIDDVKIIIDAGPHKDFDSKIEKENLKKAIQKLSQAEQNVIILRFVEDLSLKETAEVLNIGEIFCRVKQHRAIKKLKRILEQNEK